MSKNPVPDFSAFFAADLPLVSVEFSIAGQPCKLWGRALDAADSEEFERRLMQSEGEGLRGLYEWAFPRVFLRGHAVRLDPQTKDWQQVALPADLQEREAFFAPTDPEKRLPKELFNFLCFEVNRICGYGEPAEGESGASSA